MVMSNACNSAHALTWVAEVRRIRSNGIEIWEPNVVK